MSISLIDYDKNIQLLESGASLSNFDKTVISIIQKACSSFGDKQITARIAGGWVRDHIMGISNNDIDVTIDNISCDDFGEKILSFDPSYSIVHLSTGKQDDDNAMRVIRIGIAKDIWFDITDFNVTQTPLKDALRRDFTINALFFNITTMKVEDFTTGIEDLKNNILKMPIDPTESVLEDPRRVLRCFRFAARFNMSVDPSLLAAIKNTKDNFESCISKGRIGLELQKMFNSPNIIKAINLIVETDMFDCIFDPSKQCNIDPHQAFERVRKLQPVLHKKNILVYSKKKVEAVSFSNDLSDSSTNSVNC